MLHPKSCRVKSGEGGKKAGLERGGQASIPIHQAWLIQRVLTSPPLGCAELLEGLKCSSPLLELWALGLVR